MANTLKQQICRVGAARLIQAADSEQEVATGTKLVQVRTKPY